MAVSRVSDPITIIQGSCLERLDDIPEASVHCCVTSPPYWGLRDYGVAGQIGLEPRLDHYVGALVSVFAKVWRVLRDDGTLWLNLGDACNAYNHNRGPSKGANKNHHELMPAADRGLSCSSLKAKDLIGIPWRVAFALQAAGWYLRSDIIWHKPNPMPESVTDRPTKSHEYLFLFSKKPRYFYDAEAIQEKAIGPAGGNINPLKSFLHDPIKHRTKAGLSAAQARARESGGFSTRNKRSVWRVPTAAYSGAHFATFPPDLIKPCIQAGTSEGGCCAACGAPRERIVEVGEPDMEHQRACGGDINGAYHGQATKDYAAAGAQDASATKARILAGMRKRKTVGFNSTCSCEAGAVPCTVLDPFGGSGTTGAVALELGRQAILIELNPDYVDMARRRCAVTPPLPLG